MTSEDPSLATAPAPRLAAPTALLDRRTFWLLLLGFAGYASVTVLAVLAGSQYTVRQALLGGVANALPETLAAPLVLRWAASRRATLARPKSIGLLAAFAAAFGAWCLLATSGLMALMRWAETGELVFEIHLAVAPWRVAMALLAFAALFAVGTAGRRAREAHAAQVAAERAEALRARAELAALRSQLHPHFLFNVLHSLAAVVERDPRQAVAMIEKLGDLLRFGLRVHAGELDEIGLGEEVAITRQYVELEQIRLGDRLRVEWRIDPAALASGVPPFVLQSLVENAVRHAVAPRRDGGRVCITAERAGPEIVLRVEDDGEPDSRANSGRVSSGTGLGLDLLRERLRLLHGEGAALEAGPTAGAGFRAQVRIPWDAEGTERG